MGDVRGVLVLADASDTLYGTMAQLSLMHGGLPLTVQALAAAVMALAVGWLPRRWWTRWLPLRAVVGVTAAVEIALDARRDGRSRR